MPRIFLETILHAQNLTSNCCTASFYLLIHVLECFELRYLLSLGSL